MRNTISRRGQIGFSAALASVKRAYQALDQYLPQGRRLGSPLIDWRRLAPCQNRRKHHALGRILLCLSIFVFLGRTGIAQPPMAHAAADDLVVESKYETDVRSAMELSASATTATLAGAPSAPSVPVGAHTPPLGPQITTFSASAAEFTIVALPDTQIYTYLYPEIYISQTQWIVDNQATRNIAYVPHEGDIVATEDSDKHWRRADAAMSLLELATSPLHPDGIPYSVLPGNHDQPTVLYNQYFGVSRFQGRSYYGGSYEPDKNDNNYTLFSAEGMDFVIVSLQYEPDNNVLAWADNVLQTYRDRRAIVVAHSLIYSTGSFTGYGQQTYETLRDNPNLFLMLAGHSPGEARRMDVYNGNTVHTLLANYQARENGGNGSLRILTFSPANNQIRVETYSPYLDQFERDADSEFTLDYAMTADLAVSTSVSSDPVVAGQILTYTLTLTNHGPSDATGVTLTDTLPEGVTFVSATPDQGTCVQGEQTVTCELSMLDAGETTQVTIRGTVDAARRGVLINTAVAAGNELDATPANDVSLTETVVQAEADLSVIASVPSGPVVAGKSMAYALTVTNSGPSDATGVTLTDTLPAGVAFVSATPDQGTCVQAEQTVICELSNLDAGHATQITIYAMVDAARRGVLINMAVAARNEPDATPANDVSLTETAVQAEADLAASGHVSSESGAIGWNLTYALTLTNNGPSDATQVTLTNTLPAEAAFVAATSDQGTCVWTEGTVICNADAVARGTDFAVAITVRPNVIGTIASTTTCVGSEPDPDANNNTIVTETVIDDRRIFLPVALNGT